MNHVSIGACIIVLASSLYAWLQVFPEAFITGYGELPLLTPVLVAWAMWMGKRYAEPGPIKIPHLQRLSLAMLGITVVLFAVNLSWASTYLIAPAALILMVRFAPRLATPRILLLFFLAPTSFFIDSYFGESIQIATAAGTSWVTQLIDPSLGERTGNELACAPHRLIVTSACSGARMALRMTALALFVTALKQTHIKIVTWLIFIALTLSVVANTLRISVLCFAAPSYAADDLAGLEQYHDTSGIVFFIAYVIVAWLNSRLTAVYLDPSRPS